MLDPGFIRRFGRFNVWRQIRNYLRHRSRCIAGGHRIGGKIQKDATWKVHTLKYEGFALPFGKMKKLVTIFGNLV